MYDYMRVSKKVRMGGGRGKDKPSRIKEDLDWEILSDDFQPWQPLRTLCHWCVSLHSESQPRPHLQHKYSPFITSIIYTFVSILMLSWDTNTKKLQEWNKNNKKKISPTGKPCYVTSELLRERDSVSQLNTNSWKNIWWNWRLFCFRETFLLQHYVDENTANFHNFHSIFSFTWEDVSVVPLTRSEDTPITQSHWIEWTATGKQTSTL